MMTTIKSIYLFYSIFAMSHLWVKTVPNVFHLFYLTKTYNVLLADNLVVAIYSYEPNHDGDLGFEKGDKLKIINK